MADSSIWNQEIKIPQAVISFVDENVAKCSFLEGISPHGASYWTRTAQIRTIDPKGNLRSYFLKVSEGDTGKGMMLGEFYSMSALHNAVPDFTPKPVGWGSYAKLPDVHFFLCKFHEMTGNVPDKSELPKKVAQLHKNAVSKSGKFGFPVTTYHGRLPQDTTECSTWEESFSRGIRRFFEHEEEAQGYDEDMSQLRQAIMEKVIPRLLRPLESEGKSVVPCLVHGDMWDGNTAVDVATDLPIVFDACSSYAHHEYELAPWRPKRHTIGESYVAEYLKHMPKSEPTEDFDDRSALYCIRFNLCSSALYPGNLRFRDIVKEDMRTLVAKFSGSTTF